MLDTNVAIHLRDGDEWTTDKVRSSGNNILISIVTRVELEGGVYREPENAVYRSQRLAEMLTAISCLSFDDASAQAYGNIVRKVGYSRRKLLDRMIAAQAITVGATLATRNMSDFTDIPGLKLEDWTN